MLLTSLVTRPLQHLAAVLPWCLNASDQPTGPVQSGSGDVRDRVEKMALISVGNIALASVSR